MPFSVHNAAGHFKDVADAHSSVVLPGPKKGDGLPRGFGICNPFDQDSAFGVVVQKFPKAVAAGVF